MAGSSRAGVFFKVILPLLRPSLVYGGGVALLLGLGQFTAPLLLGRTEGVSVLTTDMYFATTNTPPDYALAAAIGSPLLVFGLIVMILNRVLIGDGSRFVTHGGKGGFRQGAPGSKLAAVSIVVFALISSIIPILALAAVSLSRFWTGKIDPHTWTLASYRQMIHEPGITDAIVNSVTLSLAAVAIALPVGYIGASLVRRSREYRMLAPVSDFIIGMPLSIPAVVFGVGFLLVYTNKPLVLYGTNWVLVIVYVTLMIPFSTRMQLAGMAALGDSYNEASRVSGAGLLRTQWSIMVPLMRGTFGGAAALMFVLLTHEFAASLLVRGSQIQVMGTILYDYYDNGSYPLTACISLVMVGVTTLGVAVADRCSAAPRRSSACETRARRGRAAGAGGSPLVPGRALSRPGRAAAPTRRADRLSARLAATLLRRRPRRPRVACRVRRRGSTYVGAGDRRSRDGRCRSAGASSRSSDSTYSDRRCSRSAPRSRNGGSFDRSSPPTRSGARDSRSPRRDRTSRRFARRPWRPRTDSC